jgi:translation elongation factor EF-1alpha
MSEEHDEATAIGTVTHYFGHLSVAAVSLTETLRVGERIHIKGHTSDLEQTVDSMEVDHQQVDAANPGDDVALRVDDHVREHDRIYRES